MRKKLGSYLMILCCLAGIIYNFTVSKSTENEIINNTYEQLSNIEKLEINNKSQDGSIEKVKKPIDTSKYYIKEPFNETEIYLVKFKSDLIGDIEKLVNINTGEIVGYSLRN